MPWDPNTYNQFKQIRFKPFFDLMSLISPANLKSAVDIGCGTGEQTEILASKFEKTTFWGFDSSAEMLAGSKERETERLHFSIKSIEDFTGASSGWDLIFSNAALQWTNNHHALFPKLISRINNGGQLAVQMPFQKENVLNMILLEMVQQEPFAKVLNNFVRDSPLLSVDEYATMMFEGGLQDINVFLKVYPIIAKSEMDLYNFISGSALIPYMEKLTNEQQDWFKSNYIERIKLHFPVFPAIYSFKRILMHGIKNKN